MLDGTKTLWAGLLAIAFGLILLGYFTYLNPNSRNISLAVAGLFAATMLLVVNLVFDLQGSIFETTIPVEYTIDTQGPRIRQWVYPASLGDRYLAETEASTLGLKDRLDTLKQGIGLNESRDMAVFSLISYFVLRQHDWRSHYDAVQYTNIILSNGSAPDDLAGCTVVTYDEFRDKLSLAGNIFGKSRWASGFNSICLPENTTIAITPSSVSVTNPYCRIVFEVGRSGGYRGHPRRIGDNTASEGTNAALWTWSIPLRVKINYSAWMAQNREKQKYQDWSNGLIEGVRTWFAAVPDRSSVAFDADDEDKEAGLKHVTSGQRN